MHHRHCLYHRKCIEGYFIPVFICKLLRYKTLHLSFWQLFKKAKLPNLSSIESSIAVWWFVVTELVNFQSAHFYSENFFFPLNKKAYVSMSHLNRVNWQEGVDLCLHPPLNFLYLFLFAQSLPLCLWPQGKQECGDKVPLAHMVLFVFCWHSYSHTVTNINF